MKRFLFFAVLVAVTFSCHKAPVEKPSPGPEDPLKEDTEELVFTACLSDMVTTKASMEPGKTTMVWNNEDAFSLFGGAEAQKFVIDGSAGKSSAKFRRESRSSEDPAASFSKYYALYPFDAAGSCAVEGVITVDIPGIQDYVPGSFDTDAAPMAAATTGLSDRTLQFKNVCGFVGVRIYTRSDAAVRKISLCGNGGEVLSGPAEIKVSSISDPAVSMKASASEATSGGSGEGFGKEKGTWAAPRAFDTVELVCDGDGAQLAGSEQEATCFYIAVPPVEFSKGLTVAATDVNGDVHIQTYDYPISVSRSYASILDAFSIEQAGGGTEILSLSLIGPDGTEYKSGNIGPEIEVYVPSNVSRTALKLRFETSGSELLVGGVKQESGVTAVDFSSGQLVFTVKSSKGRTRDYTVRIISRKHKISCWGDSLTHTSYNETAPLPIAYPIILQEMLGESWEVFDGGVSGDRTCEIAARQGGIRSFFKCSGSNPVSIYLDSAMDPNGSFRYNRWSVSASQPARGVNPAMVNGVECNIQYNSIQPVIPGAPVSVTGGSEIITYASRYCKDNDVLVVYMGANGGFKDYDNLIAQYKAMIDHCDKKQYIVMTMHNSKKFQIQATDADYQKKMNDAFGDHVINLRSEVNARAEEFLIKTGVVTRASDISAKDREYIKNGDWPLSFLRSETDMHPTREGSIVIATLITEKMVKLGYMEETK